MSEDNVVLAGWKRTADFYRGAAPDAVYQGPEHEVVVKAVGDNIGEKCLIASLNAMSEWVAYSFYTPSSEKERVIGFEQSRKYTTKRRNAIEANPPQDDTQSPEPDPQPQEQQVPATGGQFELAVEPEVATIFRDALTLVTQGHTVSIKLKQPGSPQA